MASPVDLAPTTMLFGSDPWLESLRTLVQVTASGDT